MYENYTRFGILDYCFFAGVLIFSCGIGLFMSYVGYKSPEEFFMGNRSFKPFSVALSLMTSYVSAVTLLGFSGEAYANGMQFSLISIGATFAILFSSKLLIPVIYPLKIISVNEYIELRFKSKRLCFLISVLTIVRNIIHSGISLYAATIPLASVTKLSTLTNILLLGTVCTVYSSFGGIRAVIWTDVFQISVMLLGLVIITVVGFHQNGGIIEILYTASKGERLQFFGMNPSPFVKHTFFNTIFYGFTLYLHWYSAEQINLQRICSVKSIQYARRVLLYNIFGMIFFYFLLFSCGLVAYASYVGCDPMALGIINRKEEILTYFVTDKLSFIPGFSGILVAAIIGGTLSTVSSILNGCVAMIWRDMFLRCDYFQRASASYATLINKIMSLVVGLLLILIAILVSYAGNLLELALTIFSTFGSPIFGVFVIGFFLPRCNLKGVWNGFILSWILILWIALGGLLYKKKTDMLPFSTEECENSNFTSMNASLPEEFVLLNSSSLEDTSAHTSFIVSLYQISYTLYAGIGTLSCILIAVIISFLTGNQKVQETSPKFIAPCVQRFYWTKEEISKPQEDEVELNILNVKESNSENSPEKLEVSNKI